MTFWWENSGQTRMSLSRRRTARLPINVMYARWTGPGGGTCLQVYKFEQLRKNRGKGHGWWYRMTYSMGTPFLWTDCKRTWLKTLPSHKLRHVIDKFCVCLQTPLSIISTVISCITLKVNIFVPQWKKDTILKILGQQKRKWTQRINCNISVYFLVQQLNLN